MHEMIQVINLRKKYGRLTALDGVNLVVKKGQVVVIIGPSGSGKSTLLRCVNYLETPTSGEIWIEREKITGSQKRLNALRSRIGMVFQHFNLYPHLTVLENVALAQRIVRRIPRQQAEDTAIRHLERVGIAEKARAYPGHLSGGQQQRVAIARALAQDPKIMLFDEPTSALDPEMIKEVLDVMLDLADDGITMVVVTHEMGFARAAAHEVVFMDHGRIIERAAPEEFFSNPAHERTRAFLAQILKH
ncbi:MAG: amino acid ABC transporter ATP-binding protein [Bellilinea sp.]|jgi:ABC-type polar amino acid transport system ATPase subunit